jgi:HEAT repeat protein
MPREQLQGLAGDVSRLLVVGARSVPGDERLRQRAGALRALAARVPALAAIADAVERVVQASPAKVVPALLDLLLTVRQARAALTESELPGEIEPLARSGSWSTSTGASDLYPVADALRVSRSDRTPPLLDAIERKQVADLRLLDLLLGALGDGNSYLAVLVADKALPLFGPTIAGELNAGLDLKGKRDSARRLEVLCRADPGAGLDLARAAFRQGSPPLRVQALRSLSELAEAAEVERAAAEVLAGRPSAEMRYAAIAALRKSFSVTPSALALLTAALRDESWNVRRGAGEALSDVGKLAVGALAAGVNDPANEDVRFESIWALGRIGAESAPAVPELLRAINDPDWRIARSALFTLGRVGKGAKSALADIDALLLRPPQPCDPLVLLTAAAARVQIGGWAPQAVTAFQTARENRDGDVRCEWARELGELGAKAKRCVDELAAALRDDVPKVRRTAAEALGCIGPPAAAAVPALMELLRDPVPFVRADAAAALGKLGRAAKAAVPVLTEMLADPDRATREAAQAAVAVLRGD